MQWRFGPYVLDLENACLWRDEQRLTIRPKTFDILVYLVEHAGELVTRDNLLEAVWPETVVADGVLATSIGELRKTLGESAREPHYIATSHRRGYRFIAPVSEVGPPALVPATPLSPSSSLTIVGREAQLERLNQVYAKALSGSRQIVFITGEAGIGKTTLVDAFVAQHTRSDAAWISQGQCIDHYGEGEPYLPLLEILVNLSKAEGSPSMVEVLSQYGPSWLLQLPALVAREETSRSQLLITQTSRERMLRELAESIETLTVARPLVVVMEDLHWSDSSTLDWLSYIARRRSSARLLILGTYRPIDALVRDHPVRSVTQELRVHGLCDELMLDYLSESSVATYLASRFDNVPFSPLFCRDLHQRTNGNPLFLINVVNAMVQQGLIHSDDSEEDSLKELDVLTFEIPDTLRQFIEQQLRHLSPEDQELLEAASVAGIEFATEAVAAALESPPETVETRSDTLARTDQFIRSSGVTTWPDGTITATSEFQHALYAEVLYDRSPLSRRTRWHHRIGLRLEAGYGTQAKEIAAELAEHFMKGRVFLQAVNYFRLAGTNALLRSAHQEAISSFERALDMVAQLPQEPITLALAIDLRFDMRHALLLRGENQQLLTYLQEAEAFAQRLEEPLQLAQALAYQCCHFYVVGDHERAIHAGERVVAISQTLPDFPLQVEINFWLGQVYHATGAYPQAIARLQQNVDALTGSQAYDFYGLAGVASVFSRTWLGLCQVETGDFHHGLVLLDQGRRIAEEVNHPFSLMAVLYSKGTLLVQSGRMRDALPILEEAFQICQRSDIRSFIPLVASALGLAHAYLDSPTTALSLMQQASEHVVQTQLLGTQVMIRLGTIAWLTGHVQEAVSYAQQALDMAQRQQEEGHQATAFYLLGRIGLDAVTPDLSKATHNYQQALALAEALDMKPLRAHCCHGLGILYRLAGQSEQARVELSHAIALYREMEMVYWLRDTEAMLEESERE